MKRFIVTIARTCGSGATPVAKLLCREYGINMYEKNLLRLAADSGIMEDLFHKMDESANKSLLYRIAKNVYAGELIPPNSDDYTRTGNLFNYQAKILKELAETESFVCIGRVADYVLKDYPNVCRILMYAPFEVCVENEMKRLGMDQKTAQKHVTQTNINRREYYRYNTGRDWENPYHYDLCLNTASFASYEACADLIKAYLDRRFAD